MKLYQVTAFHLNRTPMSSVALEVDMRTFSDLEEAEELYVRVCKSPYSISCDIREYEVLKQFERPAELTRLPKVGEKEEGHE